MDIHLARKGSALGIFSPDEVRQGLAAGRFLPDDLAWREGLTAWTPLSAWSEFAAPAAAAPRPSAEPAVGSDLPWEAAPGLRSLFRTAWLVLTRPSVLATARLESGSAFAAAYLAVGLVCVPLLLLAPLAEETSRSRLNAFAELLVESKNPATLAMGQGLLEMLEKSSGNRLLMVLCESSCLLVIFPLLCALGGFLLWPSLRLQGQPAEAGRSITSALLVGGMLLLVVFPLSATLTLLGAAAPLATWPLPFMLFLAYVILTCRSLASALRIPAWRILLALPLTFSFVLVTCCGCAMFIGFLETLPR